MAKARQTQGAITTHWKNFGAFPLFSPLVKINSQFPQPALLGRQSFNNMATATFLHLRFARQDDPGLYLVYPQDDRRHCQCDIFVVHGLRGGATRTWQHPGTGTIWFNDLLPNLLRSVDADNARIWTFGYPANLSFQTSTIHSFAHNLLHSVKNVRRGQENRSIIWVCHSLGGIVVKKALIDASLDPQYQSIRNATSGMVFLGTPHRGSAAADLGATVANVAAAAIPGFRILNRDLLKDLRRNSHALAEISGSFSRICASINIHSFFETVPQGGQVIVDHTSAILDLTNEAVRFGLNSNHQDMGKFRDQNDSNWVAVANSITELVLTTNVRPNNPPPNFFYNSYAPPQGYSPGQSPPQRQQEQQQQQQYRPPPPPPRQQQPRPPPPAPSQPATSSQSVPRKPAPSQSVPRQPASAYPTLNSSQSRMSLRPEGQPTSRQPSPRRSSPPRTPRVPDPDDPEAALCDACMESIRCSEPRVQCTVCYDYDLCLNCYYNEKVSKNHTLDHKISHVSYTELISYDDIIPVSESVNPASSPDGKMKWSLHDIAPNTPWNNTDHTISYRLLHLYEDDSHARFLAYCKPGHYGIGMDIELKFDSTLSAQARQTLKTRPEKAGRLRVTIGKIKNKQQFFGTKFPEDAFSAGTSLPPNSLPNQLLEPGFWGGVGQIMVDQSKIIFQSNRVLHINGPRDSGSVAVGIIVQWSEAASFAAPRKDPVISISLGPTRLYNIVSYSEPYIRAPPPPEATAAPEPPPSPAPAAQPQQQDEGPSVEEFIQTLLQIQREVRDREERARLEALLKIELQRQEKAKRDAVALLYAQAMQQAVEEAMAEVLEEAIMEEKKRRQEEELVRYLRALGLM